MQNFLHVYTLSLLNPLERFEYLLNFYYGKCTKGSHFGISIHAYSDQIHPLYYFSYPLPPFKQFKWSLLFHFLTRI
jgi:hypothetical protein